MVNLAEPAWIAVRRYNSASFPSSQAAIHPARRVGGGGGVAVLAGVDRLGRRRSRVGCAAALALAARSASARAASSMLSRAAPRVASPHRPSAHPRAPVPQTADAAVDEPLAPTTPREKTSILQSACWLIRLKSGVGPAAHAEQRVRSRRSVGVNSVPKDFGKSVAGSSSSASLQSRGVVPARLQWD